MENLKYCTFNTNMGWVGVLSGTNGLLAIALPQPTETEARKALGSRVEEAESAPEAFEDLISRFLSYFNGEDVPFPDKLDFAWGTPFQVSVWKATSRIPYGETRSYAWIAQQIGNPKSVRAVGQAMGRNPLPLIIPCHRVVASGGGLGGFGGGLDMKKQLLRLEAGSPLLKG